MEHFTTSNEGRTEPVWQDPASTTAVPELARADIAAAAAAAPAAAEPWHARGGTSRWTSRAAYAGAGVAALIMIGAVAATIHAERKADQALALVATSAQRVPVPTPPVAGAPLAATQAAEPQEVLPPLVMLAPEPAATLGARAVTPAAAPPKPAAAAPKPVPKLAPAAAKLAAAPKPAAVVPRPAVAPKGAAVPTLATHANSAAITPKRAVKAQHRPTSTVPAKAHPVAAGVPKAGSMVKKDKALARPVMAKPATPAKAPAPAHKAAAAVAPSPRAKAAAPAKAAQPPCRGGQLARDCG